MLYIYIFFKRVKKQKEKKRVKFDGTYLGKGLADLAHIRIQGTPPQENMHNKVYVFASVQDVLSYRCVKLVLSLL